MRNGVEGWRVGVVAAGRDSMKLTENEGGCTLILTEKPSVARDFAGALGVRNRRNGFMEGNGFVVTWAVGHLLELFEPADYDPKWRRWDLRTLPIIPETVTYKPIEQVKTQLEVIQSLLERTDVARIVIATDAGREGELIARTILDTAKNRPQNVYRFWTSQALTPEVVALAMKELKPASDFDRLWNAGKARQVADWMVGMNFSRAATLRCRGASWDTYSVGRVQTAVLALLVERKEERSNFKPEPYWILRALFSNEKGVWWGSWFKGEETRLHSQEQAGRVAFLVSGQWGEVALVKKSKKSQLPPLLHSLTDLQRDANSKYGMSAKETLDLAQKMYEERKCFSYPRTDSRVLGTQNVDLARRILDKLANRYPDIFEGVDRGLLARSNKRVFDDSKLTDHHALIPLAPLPQDAPRQEALIYDLVLRRFAAAFHPRFQYEATEIITQVCGETFRTRGSRTLVSGWKTVYRNVKEAAAEPEDGEEKEEAENLPPLKKNDQAQVTETGLQQKMTQPPPEYTEALLLKDMTNPSRHVSEEDLQKIFKGEVGLGTQATRAQIIETLLKRQYIARENKKILPTDKGCVLVQYLRNFSVAGQVSFPGETARWEHDLEKIARGEGSMDVFLMGIESLVREGVKEFQATKVMGASFHDLGACPICGAKIIEGKKGYGCSNWREADGACNFVIWKEARGRILWPGMARRLFSEKCLPAMEFVGDDGKTFSAVLKLEKDENKGTWDIRYDEKVEDFPAGRGHDVNGKASTRQGLCPRCGGEVIQGERGYGCSMWHQEDGGCRFIIWKTIAGKEMCMELVSELLRKGETDRMDGFVSRKGTLFSAHLKIEPPDYGVAFSFR